MSKIPENINNLKVPELKAKLSSLGCTRHTALRRKELIQLLDRYINQKEQEDTQDDSAKIEKITDVLNDNSEYIKYEQKKRRSEKVNVLDVDKKENNFNNNNHKNSSFKEEKHLKLDFRRTSGYYPIHHQGFCMNKSDEWMKELKEKGWTVVKVPPNDHDMKIDNLINQSLRVSNQGRVKDNYAYSTYLRNSRKQCRKVFEEIWKTDELLGSLEGLFSSKINNGWNKEFKVYQNSFDLDSSCIRGLYLLNDSDPDSGGLTVLNGSHHLFKEFMDKYDGEKLNPIINMASNKNFMFNGLKMLKICAKKDNLILWDARTFTSVIPPSKNNTPSFGAFVCMQPLEGATSEDLEERKKIIEKQSITGCWCYGPAFFHYSK